MRRLTHFVVLAAFVFSCGGQWYALQCVAWITMIHEYAQEVPLAQAISMTFSGQYPCEICKAIADKKSADTQKAFTLDKYEKKFFPPIATAIAPPTFTSCPFPQEVNLLQFRTEAPPTPPPRPGLA